MTDQSLKKIKREREGEIEGLRKRERWSQENMMNIEEIVCAFKAR